MIGGGPVSEPPPIGLLRPLVSRILFPVDPFESAEDDHSSGIPVARDLKRPTRGCAFQRTGKRAPEPERGSPPMNRREPSPHIWSCCRWGLPCHACHHARGALLPHHFTLAKPTAGPWAFGGIFLLHFPSGCPAWMLSSTVPWDPPIARRYPQFGLSSSRVVPGTRSSLQPQHIELYTARCHAVRLR